MAPNKKTKAKAGSAKTATTRLKAETAFSLKDELFNPDTVRELAGWFSAADKNFEAERFSSEVLDPFPELELKERINHITLTLAEHLPASYPTALNVILKALPPRLDPKKTDDDFGHFIIAPLNNFVAEYGAEEKHLQRSLKALREITQRFSAEDAIRTFINKFPDETLAFLADCAEDKNYHVRRWASEGTRPTLPWSQKVAIEHADTLPLLDKLFTDSTRYVTRSVANHLNDIAKVDPNLVISTLTRWKKSGKQDPGEMTFIIQHATRTLVKDGNKKALSLMGYGDKPVVKITDFVTTTPTVMVGEALEFSLALEAQKSQKLMIDYVMNFAGNPEKKGAKKGGQKVFKLKRVDAAKGKTITLKKRHPMRLMTTRQLYEGTHTVTLQVNGHALGSLSFELVAT